MFQDTYFNAFALIVYIAIAITLMSVIFSSVSSAWFGVLASIAMMIFDCCNRVEVSLDVIRTYGIIFVLTSLSLYFVVPPTIALCICAVAFLIFDFADSAYNPKETSFVYNAPESTIKFQLAYNRIQEKIAQYDELTKLYNSMYDRVSVESLSTDDIIRRQMYLNELEARRLKVL